MTERGIIKTFRLNKTPIPIKPRIAHNASPDNDPNWTWSAGQNPPLIPLLTVSAKTTPGAALNINPNKNASIKKYIRLSVQRK